MTHAQDAFTCAKRAYEKYRTTMSLTWPEDYPEDFMPWDRLHYDEQRAWLLVVKQCEKRTMSTPDDYADDPLCPRGCGVPVQRVHHECPRRPERLLAWILVRIGSLTHARFDQHLRYEFGDKATDDLLEWLKEHCRTDIEAMADERVRP